MSSYQNMHKSICITGCLGFIGSHLTKNFLNRGWDVWGIDKKTYAANTELLINFKKYKSFYFLEEDICKINTLPKVDILINSAAETHVDNSIQNSENFIQSNILGIYNLLERIRIQKSNTLIFHISTDETYGDIIQGSHSEIDILKPSNPYSSSKAAADMLIMAWARTFDIPFIIVRPTNNYGCYQFHEKLIPMICKSIITNKKIILHDNGNPKRSWLHVEDTVNAITHIILNNCKNEIFNIPGNYEDSNINITKKIVKLLTNSDDIIPFCDFSINRPGQDIRYSVDGSKLKQIGWLNEKIFDIELPKIVNFYKEKFYL